MATLASLPGVVVAASLPADVESDTNAASFGTINIKLSNVAGVSGFITIEPSAASNFANFTVGDSCTVVITDP